MQFLGYLFFRFIVFLVGLLSMPALCRISDGLAWLFYKLRYRGKVVYGNLHRCFPEKNKEEIEAIAKASYHNLSDIILEGIRSMTMTTEAVKSRYMYHNQKAINDLLKKGKSVIICGGHYANWEWGVVTATMGFEGPVYGVYKPLANKWINDYFNRSRQRAGTGLIAMRDTYEKMEREGGEPTIYFLIADQSPSNRKTAQWVDFFGNETPCLPGPDTLSRKHNFPVFHYQVTRVKRGYYQVDYTEVCMEPRAVPEGEVIQQFMKMLEKAIRSAPENWLWSHKRWKYTKKEVNN